MWNRCCICPAIYGIRDSIRCCFCPNRLGWRDTRGCCGWNRGLLPTNFAPRSGCGWGCGCGCSGGCGCGSTAGLGFCDRRFADTVFSDYRCGRFRPRSDRRYF